MIRWFMGLRWWGKVLAVLAVFVLIGAINSLLNDGDLTTPVPAATPTAFQEIDELVRDRAIYAAVIPEGSTPALMAAWAREACAGETHCQVHAWRDPGAVPTAMPMTDREADALAFTYTLNRATGLDQPMWDCDLWPGEPIACIP